MSKKTIYLDYAAATPVDESVVAAMTPYFSTLYFNPSANYLAAKSVKKDLDNARAEIAYWLGSKSTEIIFTAGGTEANNLAIDGIMSAFPGSNVVVSAIEHESVLAPSEKYDHSICPVNKQGLIDLTKLRSLINDQTVLVSVMYANNEIGTIQPLKKIAEMISDIKKDRAIKGIKLPIYFHTDACQAGAYLDLHVSRLGVDLMTVNGGKIYGPKQSGFLYVSRRLKLQPQILGGGQEFGLRSGTENVASIVGLNVALDLVQTRRSQESLRLKDLQGILAREVSKIYPKALINGSLSKRLPNNVNVTFPGQDNEILLVKLDDLGIQCATGSACNAKSESASHTLLAIGLDESGARSSLRFTLGHQTTEVDIKDTLRALKQILS